MAGPATQAQTADLSNTAFLLDALKDCGAPPDDPAIQRALIFVSRCQNLESAHNTTGFAAKNPDGGFYYTCAVGGASMAGTTPNGGLRSYGSMTYSGLTSLIYAGLQPDDPRVKAAVAWIRQNYDVRSNPGLGDAGLYYYYHVYAKALAASADLSKTPPASSTTGARTGRGTLPPSRERILGQRQQPLDGRRSQSHHLAMPGALLLSDAVRLSRR